MHALPININFMHTGPMRKTVAVIGTTVAVSVAASTLLIASPSSASHDEKRRFADCVNVTGGKLSKKGKKYFYTTTATVLPDATWQCNRGSFRLKLNPNPPKSFGPFGLTVSSSFHVLGSSTQTVKYNVTKLKKGKRYRPSVELDNAVDTPGHERLVSLPSFKIPKAKKKRG